MALLRPSPGVWTLYRYFSLSVCLVTVPFCSSSDVHVDFSRTPLTVSRNTTAAFSFEAYLDLGGNANNSCSDCSFNCKLDDGILAKCEERRASYYGLGDGSHSFVVCANGSLGVGCASYNWTIDTVPPTAVVIASEPFTNDFNVSVTISFSEPCPRGGGGGGGGFRCPSVDACNLLVYGSGQVIPSSLQVLEPELKYSLLVSTSTGVQYGRLVLVADKDFCADAAGNLFTRTENSRFFLHFDRRSVFVNLRTHIPQQLLQLGSETRTVQATNNYDNLKVYLDFSVPIVNSSSEILDSLSATQGLLHPTNSKTLGNRRFGFTVTSLSSISIVTLILETDRIISRQGTSVSPIAPLTFLYDTQRPTVRLSTTSTFRTKRHTIPVSVKFVKPVFGFNSSNVMIEGGHLKSFNQITRSRYAVEIQALADVVSISIPENATGDVAGNRNFPSNFLQIKHYSVPIVSRLVSTFATVTFLVTSIVSGLLAISTASLQSVGAFSRPSSVLTSEPSRNLFRIACHIQVFALSRWSAVVLPIEYYELARSLQWSIPHLTLPWETGNVQPIMVDSIPHSSSKLHHAHILDSTMNEQIVRQGIGNPSKAAAVYGSPLTPEEYRTFFEIENNKPEAEYVWDPQHKSGWRDFERNMFWLAVISGSLIILHLLLLLLLKLKKKIPGKHNSYGVLTFPRFEIFLLVLALPCLCQASAAIIRGRTSSGVALGIILLVFVASCMLLLLLFLSVGISFGKLLQYKEVHQVGRKFHWYQEVVRVTLGPGKRGQWTWKNKRNSVNLIKFGPLFEDLRGPPEYMLSQISGGSFQKDDRIIASDDETEDAEAPFIQKLFGILRIYYTLLECVKRVCLGYLAGAYMRNWSDRTPSVTLLCITSFQLFFMVLKKPFIKKKVQLVEIISLATQVGMFASCVVLLKKEFSEGDESKIGIFMVALFLAGFISHMANEWFALYLQTRRLDQEEKSFIRGLKVACLGLLVIILPSRMILDFKNKLHLSRTGVGESGGTASGTTPSDMNKSSGSRSSGSTDKMWLRQLREMAKTSFSREGPTNPSDPSSSRTKWSGLWGSKKSESTSEKASADFNSKPMGLHKELEAIFASK
ncbi:hypothetical protein SAY86_005025 [Trapa natans]|uniref:Bacterial Ig-like domain-containing protein n=1 Tax=Trapa natans TaxID=22666 RepID=A0AAN7KZ99_TRANT|nr:hypothetical protein SAY86_005025 [Trapa natans]